MPTYDYKCTSCGHDFETFQSIKDEPLKVCPNCGKETLRKVISGGAGLIFKGSGFYLTDYKNKPAAETKAKTSSSGESKPQESGTKESPAGKNTKESKPASSLIKSEKN